MLLAVLASSATPSGPRRALSNSGEGEPGLEHLVGHLGRMERRLQREGARSGRRERRRVAAPPPLERRLVASASAPHTTARSSSPAQDRGGRCLTSTLGHGAADPRVVATARVGADAIAPAARRVVVLPALAVHDVDASTGRGRPAAGSPQSSAGQAHDVVQHGRAARGPARRRLAGARCAAPTPMRHGVRGSIRSPRRHWRPTASASGGRLGSLALPVRGVDGSPSRTPCGPSLASFGVRRCPTSEIVASIVGRRRRACRPRPSQHRLLGGLHGQRRVGGDAVRALAGAVEQLLGGRSR